jgi:Inner membrane protein CreD
LTPARLFAIAFIFVCVSLAWVALGGSVVDRSGEADARLAREVAQLWGGKHEQVAPDVKILRPREVVEDVGDKNGQGAEVVHRVTRTVNDEVKVPLASSRIQVAMDLDQRRKGLLWYNTYSLDFAARYTVRNPDDVERSALVHLAFPSADAIYDGFVFRANGREGSPTGDLGQGVSISTVFPPGGEGVVEVAYRTRGLGDWTYAFGAAGTVGQVRDFSLAMKTDFKEIDFPAGTLSPVKRAEEGKGYRLEWTFESLVTGQKIGMAPPNRLNPGPVAARIIFFAPVPLLFFVTVMVILGVLRGNSLHPMNYFFLAAAFFAFHLLLAYLADQVSLHAAFALAAASSVFLVASYLRLVGGWRMALEASVAQTVFLVLFSYAFFFAGITGLTVSVGSVATLFVLMQATGRVDWGAVFARDTPAVDPKKA